MPTFLQDTAQPQITAMELEGLMEAGSPLSWSGWSTAFLEEFWLGWGLETSSLGDPDNPDDPAFWDPSLHCQLGERVGAFCWLEFCNLGLKPIKLTWNRNPTRSSRHFCSRKNPWLFCVSWAFACCCAAARQCLKKTWGQLGLHDVGLLQEFPSSWSWMCWHDLPYSVSISLWRVPCVPCVCGRTVMEEEWPDMKLARREGSWESPMTQVGQWHVLHGFPRFTTPGSPGLGSTWATWCHRPPTRPRPSCIRGRRLLRASRTAASPTKSARWCQRVGKTMKGVI